MKFGSLFAGIGGIDLGLERAGMECAWQVENDEYCQKVLAKHWPDVPRYGDIRGLTPPSVDLIAGGFPCQPHSVAGKRGGAEDDRNLWPEFIRVIRELKPRYVLAENVPGIITTYIDTVLSDLEGEGYTCPPLNLPAVAFDALHRRERIFIVAYTRHAESQGWKDQKNASQGPTTQHETRRIIASRGGKENLADTTRQRINRGGQAGARRRAKSSDSGEGLAYPDSEQAERATVTWEERNPWTTEPNVGRVAHGVPSRVHRLRGLGNAVVPQVAEWIGRRIMEFDGD